MFSQVSVILSMGGTDHMEHTTLGPQPGHAHPEPLALTTPRPSPPPSGPLLVTSDADHWRPVHKLVYFRTYPAPLAPIQERHLVVSKWAVCILLECFLVTTLPLNRLMNFNCCYITYVLPFIVSDFRSQGRNRFKNEEKP